MKKYSFALSDSLCKQYLLFKNQSPDFNKSIISRLLRYHTGDEFIFSLAQADRVGCSLSPSLKIALTKSRLSKGEPTDLAKKTEYKLVLTENNSGYPYVNIYEDSITPAIIGCFYQNQPRDKAINHIKTICEKAQNIIVYDKFLSHRTNYTVLKDIIPNNKINIQYVKSHIEDVNLTDLKNTLTNCIFQIIPDTDTQHHDRYLIIDDKIEIILTSGFEYLKSLKKEISYIIRYNAANRLK